MTFAKRVFTGAGIWGVLVLTPMYFLFDTLNRQLTINYPQFFFGFLAITMAWQTAFLVIGSDPLRFRPLMIPAMIEKFGFIATIVVLYVQGRAGVPDLVVVAPDCVLGILFAISFAKTSDPAFQRSRSATDAMKPWTASI
jgi:hypothetical protein